MAHGYQTVSFEFGMGTVIQISERMLVFDYLGEYSFFLEKKQAFYIYLKCYKMIYVTLLHSIQG